MTIDACSGPLAKLKTSHRAKGGGFGPRGIDPPQMNLSITLVFTERPTTTEDVTAEHGGIPP
jgi:hypothetical protein